MPFSKSVYNDTVSGPDNNDGGRYGHGSFHIALGGSGSDSHFTHALLGALNFVRIFICNGTDNTLFKSVSNRQQSINYSFIDNFAKPIESQLVGHQLLSVLNFSDKKLHNQYNSCLYDQ